MINLDLNVKVTWEDVCEKMGIHPMIHLPRLTPETKKDRYLNACYKLSIISEWLNEGVILDFNDRNQYKYYPYFRKEASGWVVYSFFSDDFDSVVGFGSYYKDSNTALYAAKMFFDIYLDYLPD